MQTKSSFFRTETEILEAERNRLSKKCNRLEEVIAILLRGNAALKQRVIECEEILIRAASMIPVRNEWLGGDGDGI